MGRSARLLLSWLVSVSYVLMPYSTRHAHVADDQPVHFHGGHTHDLDSDHDVRIPDEVVTITVPATPSSAATDWTWTDWQAAVNITLILALTLPFVTAILRPPSRKTEPISRRSRRQPPLRGPPLSILAL
jgi:hypothetical protein